ncbi:UDP-glycosyltransferase 92A1-like [Pistacia vera]|uniref:UDP-glycosyltransferase 92A1-like n=1 Tax=Pistacia vera TaxID=55513 RepID=UPI001262B390|nr:UDP-glycosyltransferase 92A1-like [Pistacia vera]
MAETKQNVILFPFMAQGHIIPFLALALHIQKTRKNCTITFVNTPLNIKKLRSSLPKSSPINFVEIPFNSSLHGLPPDSENCDALPYSLIIQLLRASASLKPAFRELINDLICRNNGADAPLCIIADIFFGWTAGVAQEFNVFHAIFSGAGGFGLACYYSVWRNLPHKKGESEDFLLPDFEEAGKIQKTQLALSMLQADGSDPWSLFQGGNLPEYVNSNGILFNTVEEFDKLGLKYFNRKLNRPVWAIGPILLSLDNRAQAGKDKESGISSEFCKEWLDSKPEKSVLYISFGSMNVISLSHMKELAMALEASEKNFIWVVRPPIGFDINSEFRGQEWLPEGFEERVILGSKRGLLVKKWAPQVEILSHKAIGGFLSHCGWNSVLEALIHGVPILGWPMAAEQFFNVKFLEEEMGICVEVARGKTCELRHEDIEAKIEMVMSVKSKKGIEIRRNVGKVREMIKNAMRDEEYKGSSVKAMDEFFNAALSMKEKNKRKLINGA